MANFRNFFKKGSGGSSDSQNQQQSPPQQSPPSSRRTFSNGLALGAGVAGAGVGIIAVGAKTGVSLFRLMGRFTFLFVVLAGALHYFHITRVIAQPAFWDIYLFLYLVLGLFAAVFFWNDPNDFFPIKRIVKFLLLALFAYIVPFLLQQLAFYQLLDLALIRFLVIFTPVLVLYAFMDPGDGLTRFTAGVYFFIVFVLAITQLIIPALRDANVEGPITLMLTPEQVRDTLKQGWGSVKMNVDQAQTSITTQVKDGSQRLTQEIYTGQVDSSQGLPLGVQLVEAQTLLQRFSVDIGDDIIATATVQARTINDEPYLIRNTCYFEYMPSTWTGTQKVIVPGTVNPKDFTIGFTGDQYDRRLIECVVRSSDLRANKDAVNVVSGRIVFNSTFEFATSGYMTYAFMDRNLFASLRSDGREPWRELGLQGPTTIARYTPGPVMIGMPADTTPYPVESTGSAVTLPPFAVTFSSASFGRGGIESFGDTYVYVPRFFNISSECTPRQFWIERNATQSTQYGSDFATYRIRNLSRAENQQFVTVRCPLEMNPAVVRRASDILGLTGGGVYTFFVTSRYTYAIDTSVAVTARFPLRTSTAGAGLTVNVPVLADAASCVNTNAYCTGSQNDGTCYCFHRNGAQNLQRCSWRWGEGRNDNAKAAIIDKDVSKGQCSDSAIPAGCSAGISCTGTACRCVYPLDDNPATPEIETGSRDCRWDVFQSSGGVTCTEYRPESR